jgi:hypothetical protein
MYNAQGITEFLYSLKFEGGIDSLTFMTGYLSLQFVLFALTCFTMGLMIVDYLKSYPKNNELF